ncbi:MAG TPA: type II secretion system protein GspM, partial [Gammaproteobacteria bacterium]|nr:type II secretion system protein GspM [Gammaproteobacteria bacterium]
MKEQLLQHWEKLQPREKHLLMGAVAFLIVVLLYMMAQSAFDRTITLEQNLKKEQELLVWMPPVV